MQKSVPSEVWQYLFALIVQLLVYSAAEEEKKKKINKKKLFLQTGP